MKKSPLINFDNHVVANFLSPKILKILTELEFISQNVTGGDARVRMNFLYSKKSSSLKEADDLFETIKSHLITDENFIGYIEEEIITSDEFIHYRPLTENYWDSILIKLNPVSCPEGIYKVCDLHLAVHNTHPEIEQKLLTAGFYYIELNKPRLGKIRIYTIQTQDLKIGKIIFRNLRNILLQGGGIEGFLKFELTRNIYNQGFVLPPLILK